MTIQELEAMPDAKIAKMAAEILGYPMIHKPSPSELWELTSFPAFSLDFFGGLHKFTDRERSALYRPTTDANQAVELAEQVSKKCAIRFTANLSEGYEAFYFSMMKHEYVEATAPTFARALTLAAILAWSER